jgi:hypothetical protein
MGEEADMKIRVIRPFTKHEIAKQNEAWERQLEEKRVERLQHRLAAKLTQGSQVPVPRVA